MKSISAPAHRPRGLRRVAVVAAGCVVALGAMTLTTQVAHAAVACSVDYSITGSWGGGFQSSVTIKNTGEAVSSWTLGWSFANGQKITQLWSGSYSQTGAAVKVSNLSYNASIPSGGSTNFGFLGSWTGSND